MIKKTDIHPADTTLQSSLPLINNVNNVTVTSTSSRIDPSQQMTISNTSLQTREINQEPFNIISDPQIANHMRDALQRLPLEHQLQEGQTVAEGDHNIWQIILQKGVLLWVLLIMKMKIMMPVYEK